MTIEEMRQKKRELGYSNETIAAGAAPENRRSAGDGADGKV